MSFASGQVYVALSRCTNLEGLVLASRIIPSNIINDSRVHDYISAQQKAAEDSIRILPQLKENYYRIQLTDLFNFNRLYAIQQDLYRTIVEYFHSYPRLTDFMRETLEQVKKEVLDVAYKWRNVILQMPDDKLHDEATLRRVRRSADYFAAALKKNIPKLLNATKGVNGKNRKALEQLDERYKAFWLEYLAKEKLLDEMADTTFSIAKYLKAKQESLLDAMDTINPGSKQKRKKTKKTSSSPSYDNIM